MKYVILYVIVFTLTLIACNELANSMNELMSARNAAIEAAINQ